MLERDEERVKKIIISMAFMLTIPILHQFYGLLNNGSRGVYILITPLDKVIPFMKVFILPYIIWYPYIFGGLLFLCMNDRETYFKILLSVDIGFIFSYIIFYFFQTTVPRPGILGSDLLSQLVRIIYNHDKPYNCLPSIHVLTTYYVMKGIRSSTRSNNIIKYLAYTIGILIILSTQFVKQHVILDVITAVIIAELVYRTIEVIFQKYLENSFFNSLI